MTNFDDMTLEQRRAYWTENREAATTRNRERKPTDKIDALFHDACNQAAIGAEQDGLYPKSFTEWNEPRYTIQQGLRAAHVGREDSAATLVLMRPVLHYLTTIRTLLWGVIAFLAVILWRVW